MPKILKIKEGYQPQPENLQRGYSPAGPKNANTPAPPKNLGSNIQRPAKPTGPKAVAPRPAYSR